MRRQNRCQSATEKRMAGSDEEKKPEKPTKPLGERLRDLVQGVLDELQALLDPPRPVRAPVPAGPRRPR